VKKLKTAIIVTNKKDKEKEEEEEEEDGKKEIEKMEEEKEKKESGSGMSDNMIKINKKMLSSISTPSSDISPKTLDIFTRLYLTPNIRSDEIIELEKRYSEKDMKECSFAPALSLNSMKLTENYNPKKIYEQPKKKENVEESTKGFYSVNDLDLKKKKLKSQNLMKKKNNNVTNYSTLHQKNISIKDSYTTPGGIINLSRKEGSIIVPSTEKRIKSRSASLCFYYIIILLKKGM
jgi:hypothetical protein